MSGRTFAVGDVHGDRAALERLLARLPPLDAGDTLLFIGDYVDRGPESRQVVDLVRLELPRRTAARLVTLCGNHEEAWLKTVAGGGPGFVMPPGNGCLATYRSYTGGAAAGDGGLPSSLEEMKAYFSGSFFPPEVLAWMRALPYYHEDEHAIYLHGGLPPVGGRFAHPREYPIRRCSCGAGARSSSPLTAASAWSSATHRCGTCPRATASTHRTTPPTPTSRATSSASTPAAAGAAS